jgi:ribosomal protein S18 acetylase RimI-like enzyme
MDWAACGLCSFLRQLFDLGGTALYLEDLYVRPQFRGKRIGTALLSAVADLAVREEKKAMQWEVLDWNQGAIALYRSLGAEFRDQWKSVLLADDNLRRLAERKS